MRKARTNAADVHEADDVFMYRDSSVAPPLDLKHGIKAVMDVLDSMITVQWGCILRTGLVFYHSG